MGYLKKENILVDNKKHQSIRIKNSKQYALKIENVLQNTGVDVCDKAERNRTL